MGSNSTTDIEMESLSVIYNSKTPGLGTQYLWALRRNCLIYTFDKNDVTAGFRYANVNVDAAA